VVTGAYIGIDTAVARALAHEGAHVALAVRRRDTLLEVQSGLEELGGTASLTTWYAPSLSSSGETSLDRDSRSGPP
jgi:NADP-dependent 3-hydroxy acid dehydrogenase YdfG